MDITISRPARPDRGAEAAPTREPLSYEVIELAVSDLDDPAAITRHFKRLANLLRKDDVRARLRTDESRFPEAAPGMELAAEPRFSLRLVRPSPAERYVGCLPLMPV